MTKKPALMAMVKQALEKAVPGAFAFGTCYNDKGSTYRRKLKMPSCVIRRLTDEEVLKAKKAIKRVVDKSGEGHLKRTVKLDEIYVNDRRTTYWTYEGKRTAHTRDGTILVYMSERCEC